jgi:hypothetical protein
MNLGQLQLPPEPGVARRWSGERHFPDRQRTEALVQRCERLLTHARADAAGVNKPSIRVEVTEQKSADISRNPSGSDHPTTTNSARLRHLVLIQAPWCRASPDCSAGLSHFVIAVVTNSKSAPLGQASTPRANSLDEILFRPCELCDPHHSGEANYMLVKKRRVGRLPNSQGNWRS